MRTLSLIEVEQVSGAGTIADAASNLGGGIGAVIDALGCITNGCNEKAGRQIGHGIGEIIEALCPPAGTNPGTNPGKPGGSCCGGNKPSKPSKPGCSWSWC